MSSIPIKWKFKLDSIVFAKVRGQWIKGKNNNSISINQFYKFLTTYYRKIFFESYLKNLLNMKIFVLFYLTKPTTTIKNFEHELIP